MRHLLATAAVAAIIAASQPAFATGIGGQDQSQGQNQGQTQGQTAYGGTGVGIGKGGDAYSSSGSSSKSAAGAAAVGINSNSAGASSAGQSASQDTNVDASSSDRTNIPVGAAISLSYAPNSNPEATVDAAARTVVTNTSYHFLDPLWGHAFQDVQPTVEFSYFLAVKSYEFSNEGYAATAILCSKEPAVAKQLRRACE